jgi:hypothetical protein
MGMRHVLGTSTYLGLPSIYGGKEQKGYFLYMPKIEFGNALIHEEEDHCLKRERK